MCLPPKPAASNTTKSVAVNFLNRAERNTRREILKVPKGEDDAVSLHNRSRALEDMVLAPSPSSTCAHRLSPIKEKGRIYPIKHTKQKLIFLPSSNEIVDDIRSILMNCLYLFRTIVQYNCVYKNTFKANRQNKY